MWKLFILKNFLPTFTRTTFGQKFPTILHVFRHSLQLEGDILHVFYVKER